MKSLKIKVTQKISSDDLVSVFTPPSCWQIRSKLSRDLNRTLKTKLPIGNVMGLPNLNLQTPQKMIVVPMLSFILTVIRKNFWTNFASKEY